jgi:sugar phosphate isomerase/epimerase
MLKFSFNSTTLREVELFEALRRIQAAGYESVELMLNNTHIHPLNTPHQRVVELRDFCRGEGILIASIAAGGADVLSDKPYQPTFFDPDPAQRARRVDFLARSIELADFLEVPVIDFNSGPVHPDVSRNQSVAHIAEAIDSLLARGGNAILSLEPEPNFAIGATVDAIALIQQIDNPRLALTTDIGHVNCSEDDYLGAIERAIPYTRNIHIEDIKRRVHAHEIPGEGDIDFAQVFAILHKTNYRHYVAVELHAHNDRIDRALNESLAYLNRFKAAA